jgi:integrase
VSVPEVDDSVFIIPDTVAKNGQERIVVLNRIARKVVEGERGKHPRIIFTYYGERLSRVRNHAWKKARDRAGLPEVRVHDLRHTFGHRLRAAGVSFEDRQDLLGHKSARITTHYSSPDLIRLLSAANLLCEKRPATILRVATGGIRKKLPQNSRKAVPQKDSGLPEGTVRN